MQLLLLETIGQRDVLTGSSPRRGANFSFLVTDLRMSLTCCMRYSSLIVSAVKLITKAISEQHLFSILL